MVNDIELLSRIESDLGLNVPFEKGSRFRTRNVWHFYTDGAAVDAMFYDKDDFVSGMNRIYVVSRQYDVIIIAFVLMDTHVHFVLYGEFSECQKFIHDYLKRTSMYISHKHCEQHKLMNVSVSYQEVDSDTYLKTVICYVIKNPVSGGLPYLSHDYPWSSGSLYFRHLEEWTSPFWISSGSVETVRLGYEEQRSYLKCREIISKELKTIGEMVFPGEYVAKDIVERIFRTPKSFSFFMGKSRDEDVESRGMLTSRLSIPMQELRQYRRELCLKLFGVESTRVLSANQRLKLARIMKSRYNSSARMIARLSGLVYDEIKDLL